jgi:ADP-ribose pyrophosphatase YjhB (NUDIX family)
MSDIENYPAEVTQEPTFNNVPNKSYQTTCGKTIWASRSVCVCIKVILRDINDKPFSLITKRGKAVSNEGKWCLPCGFIDFNETIVEAAQRELYEETGIYVPTPNLHAYEDMDDPNRDAMENITHHFLLDITVPDPEGVLRGVNKFIDDGKTNDESTEAALVDAHNYKDYDYAFNHAQRVTP